MGYDWIVVNAKTQCYECHRCGTSVAIPQLPMEIMAFVQASNSFVTSHAACKERQKQLISDEDMQKIFAEKNADEQQKTIDEQRQFITRLQSELIQLKELNHVKSARIDALQSALVPFVFHKKALASMFGWKDELLTRVYACGSSELRWGAFLQAEQATKGMFYVEPMSEQALTERDPGRIDPMMADLTALWKTRPQERLTQLIVNYLSEDTECPQFFYQEDYVTAANIKAELKRNELRSDAAKNS